MEGRTYIFPWRSGRLSGGDEQDCVMARGARLEVCSSEASSMSLRWVVVTQVRASQQCQMLGIDFNCDGLSTDCSAL